MGRIWLSYANRIKVIWQIWKLLCGDRYRDYTLLLPFEFNLNNRLSNSPIQVKISI